MIKSRSLQTGTPSQPPNNSNSQSESNQKGKGKEVGQTNEENEEDDDDEEEEEEVPPTSTTATTTSGKQDPNSVIANNEQGEKQPEPEKEIDHLKQTILPENESEAPKTLTSPITGTPATVGTVPAHPRGGEMYVNPLVYFLERRVVRDLLDRF